MQAEPYTLPLNESATRCQVTCIIVSWNVRDVLLDCLASIIESANESALAMEIVVVDNASSDGTIAALSERFPNLRLIANQENVGFGRAVNQAARIATSPYLLILNPDTTPITGALGRLVQSLDRNPAVGLAGPAVIDAAGRPEQPCRRFPRRQDFFLESTILERLWPTAPAIRRYRCADLPLDSVQFPDWLTGAALMLRRAALADEQIFDARFFMYSEELDLCRRLRADGWQVMYQPAAVVQHAGARSSSQNVYRRNIHFHDSKALYIEKYHGALLELSFRLFVSVSMALNGLEDWLKGRALPQERARLERAAMYVKLAQWHFRRAIERLRQWVTGGD